MGLPGAEYGIKMRGVCLNPSVPEEIPNGPKLLNDVHTFLGRFVAYESDNAQIAHTLWIGHAHLMDAWDSLRIAFLLPSQDQARQGRWKYSASGSQPRSRPSTSRWHTSSARSPMRRAPPTLLFDEIDTVFGPKAKDNEEIRGLLNAGHRKGAVAGRCVVRGKTFNRRAPRLLRCSHGWPGLSARHDPHALRSHQDAATGAHRNC